MKSKEIIFYAPLGKGIPASRCGGAEAGCHKTLDIYRNADFHVFILNKPAKAQGIIKYLGGMLIAPFLLIKQLLLHPQAPVHLVGFYRDIVIHEFLLMQICRLFNHKVIYEPRNGSLVTSYQTRGYIYRNILKSLLVKPDVVLCQGLEYVDFIKTKWGISRTYYPNFIKDDFIKSNNINRDRQPIKLIYFGRVTPAKKVEIVIEATALLKREGQNVVLDIVGGYDESYYKLLYGIAKNHEICDIITFHGRQDFAFIAKNLQNAHYFIFPSQETQEGHSNSLTEAMGCGVVPIVSNAGFNASICGNPELVVKGMDAHLYADKIMEIETNHKWSRYSEAVYNRVMQNYTEKVVGERLISTIEQLYE